METLAQVVLQMIVHTLNNQEDRQWADLSQITALTSGDSDDSATSGLDPMSLAIALSDQLSEVATQPGQAEESVERKLRAAGEDSVGGRFPRAGGVP